MKAMRPLEAKRRFERLYMATTGAKTPIGAPRWIARQLGVTRRAVFQWTSGNRKVSQTTLRLVEMLEGIVGTKTLAVAGRRLTRYYTRKVNE